MITNLRRGLRGLAAAVATVAVMIALPWALVRYIGWPLPRVLPNTAAVQAWIDEPFTPGRVFKAAAIVLWLLWISMVVLIALEAAATIRRVRTPRVRLATPLQKVAAGMVGATVATFATAAAQAAPPAATVDDTAIPDDQAGATDQTAAGHQARANIDATSSTAVAGRGLVGMAVTEPTYTIVAGDWLTAIADRFLGDSAAVADIQALNPDLEARDHRFPNHIEPGWRLRLPVDAYDRGIRLHAAGHLYQLTTPPTTVPDPTPPAPTQATPQPAPPVPVPTPPVPTPPAGTPDGNPPAGDRASTAEPAVPEDQAWADDGEPDVVVGPMTTGAMAGAGLLASLLFAMLTAERRRQRGFFPAGQEPPQPANGKAEQHLRAAQQPADVQRLDAALSGLAPHLIDRHPRSDIVGVRLAGGDVHILLAQPVDNPPAPWLDEGNQWTLPAYVEPPTVEDRSFGALLPLLITVGSRAGRHLLVDLERLGTLSIAGHPYRARDLLRHIVCELACATWAHPTTVLVAGFGDEGETLTDINPDRLHTVTIADGVATIHTELARRATTGPISDPLVLVVANPDTTGRAALADLHRDLVAAGRCGIAVVTTVPDHTPLGIATVTVDDTGILKTAIPGLHGSTDAAAVPVDLLDPMAQVFRAARLTNPTPPTQPQPEPATGDLPAWDDAIDPADGVLALFTPHCEPPPVNGHASAQTTPPPAINIHDSDPTLDADLAAWTTDDPHRPRLAILGPIQAHLPGEVPDSKRRLYLEMLLYLLTRTTRTATREQIEDALWYGNPAGEGSIRAAISRLRKYLGRHPDATPWITEGNGPDRAYHLADGVLLDWHLLLRLRGRAERRGVAGVGDYRAALHLVRGVPMRDVPDRGPYRRPYTWIGDSDINPGRLIATITDIAHRVATHHLDDGDTTTARWAITQAWLADPDRSYDDLWLDHLRAEHIDGHAATLQRITVEFLAARDAEVVEDLPTLTYDRLRALVPEVA